MSSAGVSFPSRTATVGSLLAVSGGGASTIFSGAGVCLGVIAYPLSGSAKSASFSGVGSLLVMDAVSGMYTINSGANIIYNCDFGTSSGFVNGVNCIVGVLPELGYAEVFCNSGLVAQTVSGWGLTVIYNK